MHKILIADDEPHIRLLLQQTLEELEEKEVEIISVGDGEAALEGIMSERPSLVFLDVMMPKMNGFEVCETVKKGSDTGNTVIILLTAKGQEFDRQKGLESGADAYMTKPFDPDEVLAMAKEVLGIFL